MISVTLQTLDFCFAYLYDKIIHSKSEKNLGHQLHFQLTIYMEQTLSLNWINVTFSKLKPLTWTNLPHKNIYHLYQKNQMQ